MKVKKLFLKNFRSFYGKIEIPIEEDFTTFIGRNDHGKSSILEALDIFIKEGKDNGEKIDANDLNIKAKNEGKDEFCIGVVFTDFPEKVVIDESNETSLKEEYLLNGNGNLEVWKTFKNGKLISTSIRCNHPVNDEFVRDLLRKKMRDLKKFVDENNLNCSDKRKSAELRKSIRDFYKDKDRDLKLEEIEIIVDAEDVKKIWEKLSNYLPVYALFHSDRKNTDLDSEIQDPLKITIDSLFKRDEIQNKLKEIAKEIDKELRMVSSNTINKFKEVSKLETNVSADLPEVNELKWKDVYKNIGFKTDDGIPMNKRGSGFRRLLLLSFFMAEAEKGKNETKTHIIYAIEEPETSLHPDLQKIFLEDLLALSSESAYQIIITTHSPQFIRLLPTVSIRYVEKTNVSSYVEVFEENNSSVLNKIISNLGVLPMVGKVIWCIEGKNDESFLTNINKNIPELKNIIDIEEAKNAGLFAFNVMNGSNLDDYINRYITKNTNAIEFHLYDKDENHAYKDEIEKVNKRDDGSFACETTKREIENYIPRELISKRFSSESFKVDLNDVEDWNNADIPEIIAQIAKIKSDKVKTILCTEVSQKITKEHLESLGAWDEVKSWFEKIKEIVDKVTV